jgi:hypothetical protein
MTRHRLIAAALPLAFALTLTGCGSSSSPSSKATVNAQDQMLKFAQCLRQHGINVPDPKPGAVGLQVGANGQGFGSDKLGAAVAACKQYDPAQDTNPNDPKQRDYLLKTAQCLRKHGIHVADPQPGHGLDIQDSFDADRLKAANEACRKEVGPPAGKVMTQ